GCSFILRVGCWLQESDGGSVAHCGHPSVQRSEGCPSCTPDTTRSRRLGSRTCCATSRVATGSRSPRHISLSSSATPSSAFASRRPNSDRPRGSATSKSVHAQQKFQ